LYTEHKTRKWAVCESKWDLARSKMSKCCYILTSMAKMQTTRQNRSKGSKHNKQIRASLEFCE
jgi:hypothetical protein